MKFTSYLFFVEYQTVISSRQQLDSQLTENNGVRDELNILEPTANVFKLVGPVLVKQDLDEAKQNVNKRVDYITGEMYNHIIFIQLNSLI